MSRPVCGTIAMRPEPGTGKLVPLVSGDELVEMIGWADAPPVELDDFARAELRLVWGAGPVRAPALSVPERLALVDLHRLYAGSDGRFVRPSLETGAEAIVLEGTGRGNASDQVVEAVREATARGVPVVVCSRSAAGRVAPVYGHGGGRDLEEAGALFAGDLAGSKARVLLQVPLGAGLDAGPTLAAECG